MKNSKKAFTLVELLVVIAILAVLASVSIIGYTAFTKKAVENNAISELTQVKTLITSGTTADSNNEFVVDLDGTNKVVVSFDEANNKYKFKAYTSETIELTMSTEANLKGKFTVDVTNQTIEYELENGSNKATSVWDFSAGSVSIK